MVKEVQLTMASNKNYNQSSQNSMNQTNSGSGNLKYEVANELGIELGPNTSSRNNGRVGGSITRELVNRGKQNSNTENMKYETASELGVELGPDASARSNGSVGGSMTKKLVSKGKEQASNSSNSNN